MIAILTVIAVALLYGIYRLIADEMHFQRTGDQSRLDSPWGLVGCAGLLIVVAFLIAIPFALAGIDPPA